MTAIALVPTRRVRLPITGRLLTGLIIVGFFLLVAAVGPVLTDDPELLVGGRLKAPSAEHWLGTTATGQDVFNQLVSATRGSVLVGVLVGVLATAISLVVGVAGGYFGGWLDELFSLVSNVVLVIPGLPLLILIADYLEDSGAFTFALIITLTFWAGPSRVIRAQTLSLRNRDYVDAARVSGEPHWRIMVFQILPNLTPIVASGFVFAVITGILTEAGLSFLGLAGGASGSWGGMLYFAQSGSALGLGAWWWFVPPGLCVALIGAGLSLINFSIDEMMNPRLRKAAS